MVAYREGWNVESVVVDTNALLSVTGDTESVLVAASPVTKHGFTPFDALHLVNSAGAPIVSSSTSYAGSPSGSRSNGRTTRTTALPVPGLAVSGGS